MEIIYFPYISLGEKDELNFGNAKVWNFSKKAEEYIPDEKLREYIRSILNSNVANNRPIEDIGVVSIGSVDFREFNEEEFQIINEVRLVMFLAFLSRHNTIGRKANAGWFMATSENYEFFIQRFDPYNEYISESTGHIINIGIGGYKIGEKKFYKPSHVITPQRFSLDGLLITNFIKLNKRGGKKLYRRILKATDLIFESYYNNPNLSKNARVLLQIAAFETLLDLPMQGQRKVFKDKVEAYCNLQNEKIYSHYYENHGKKIPEKRSMKAIWADSYYTLRNHIIHGDQVAPQEFAFKNVQRHIDIAILFFVLLVKKLLNEKYGNKVFYDEAYWGKEKDGEESYKGFIYKDNDLTRLITQSLNKRRKVVKVNEK